MHDAFYGLELSVDKDLSDVLAVNLSSSWLTPMYAKAQHAPHGDKLASRH